MFCDGGSAGKQRGGMAVVAQPQQEEIQARPVSWRRSDDCAKQPFILARCKIRIGDLPAHTMDVVHTDVEGTKESSIGQTEVAVGMIRRYTALVTEEEGGMRPIESIDGLCIGQSTVQPFRRGASR